MKQLVVDIKDGYAILALGGDCEPGYYKFDFDESQFGDANGDDAHSELGLMGLGGQPIADLYNKVEIIVLTVPLRFSMIKAVSIDLAAIETYGDEYLNWEASQQLPGELGEFRTGFYKLRSSFDRKNLKYLFYASTSDFIDVLSKFVLSEAGPELVIESEALGLFKVIDLASDRQGFCAAVSLEQNGAAVIITQDGDFIAGKFIAGDNISLGEEIMYYIMAHSSVDSRPKMLICGDLAYLANLGVIDWADTLELPETLGLSAKYGVSNPGEFVVAAGLNLRNVDQP